MAILTHKFRLSIECGVIGKRAILHEMRKMPGEHYLPLLLETDERAAIIKFTDLKRLSDVQPADRPRTIDDAPEELAEQVTDHIVLNFVSAMDSRIKIYLHKFEFGEGEWVGERFVKREGVNPPLAIADGTPPLALEDESSKTAIAEVVDCDRSRDCKDNAENKLCLPSESGEGKGSCVTKDVMKTTMAARGQATRDARAEKTGENLEGVGALMSGEEGEKTDVAPVVTPESAEEGKKTDVAPVVTPRTYRRMVKKRIVFQRKNLYSQKEEVNVTNIMIVGKMNVVI